MDVRDFLALSERLEDGKALEVDDVENLGTTLDEIERLGQQPDLETANALKGTPRDLYWSPSTRDSELRWPTSPRKASSQATDVSSVSYTTTSPLSSPPLSPTSICNTSASTRDWEPAHHSPSQKEKAYYERRFDVDQLGHAATRRSPQQDSRGRPGGRPRGSPYGSVDLASTPQTQLSASTTLPSSPRATVDHYQRELEYDTIGVGHMLGTVWPKELLDQPLLDSLQHLTRLRAQRTEKVRDVIRQEKEKTIATKIRSATSSSNISTTSDDFLWSWVTAKFNKTGEIPAPSETELGSLAGLVDESPEAVRDWFVLNTEFCYKAPLAGQGDKDDGRDKSHHDSHCNDSGPGFTLSDDCNSQTIKPGVSPASKTSVPSQGSSSSQPLIWTSGTRSYMQKQREADADSGTEFETGPESEAETEFETDASISVNSKISTTSAVGDSIPVHSHESPQQLESSPVKPIARLPPVSQSSSMSDFHPKTRFGTTQDVSAKGDRKVLRRLRSQNRRYSDSTSLMASYPYGAIIESSSRYYSTSIEEKPELRDHGTYPRPQITRRSSSRHSSYSKVFEWQEEQRSDTSDTDLKVTPQKTLSIGATSRPPRNSLVGAEIWDMLNNPTNVRRSNMGRSETPP